MSQKSFAYPFPQVENPYIKYNNHNGLRISNKLYFMPLGLSFLLLTTALHICIYILQVLFVKHWLPEIYHRSRTDIASE